MGRIGRVLSEWVQHDPQPGVSYPAVLVVPAPEQPPMRSLLLGVSGSILGLATMMLLSPWVVTLVMLPFWWAAGSPENLFAWARPITNTFAEPSGMVATHLGLATLIPISMALVLFVHRFHPRWLHSVQPGFRWRLAAISTGAGLIVLGAFWAVSRIGASWQLNPGPAFWGFLIAIVLTSPLQAAAEEYFFRGYLMQAIYSSAPVNNPWFAVVGSALVFALLHGGQNLPAFAYRFGFGLIAGWLVVRTGGLEAAIGAHIANNLIAFGWADLSGTMAETRTASEISWLELSFGLGGFLVFALLAVALARRLRAATTTPKAQFGAGDEV